MRFIQADFEVITPMFLGGANHEAGNIRPASVKAEILFWWRALNYHRFAFNNGKTVPEAEALKSFHTQEAKLFGCPTKGQGVFSLSARWVGQAPVMEGTTPIVEAFGQDTRDATGAKYLGYGIVTIKGQIEAEKSCIKAGAKFVIELVFKPSTSEHDIADIQRAVKLMGLLGGLGSRKRRGWGSLALTSLKSSALKRDGAKFGLAELQEFSLFPANTANFEAALNSAVLPSRSFDERSAPLSCFGSNTRMHRWSAGFASALDAMNALGNGYQLYRAWGRSEYGNLMPDRTTVSHKNFKADHDWFKVSKPAFKKADRGTYTVDSVKPPISANNMPERAIFGLPLGFAKGVEIETTEPFGRRASPLLFHIAKIGSQFYPVATYFQTQFLPLVQVGAEAAATRINVPGANNLPFQPDTTVVTNYLDGTCRNTLDGARNTHPYFNGVRVLP